MQKTVKALMYAYGDEEPRPDTIATMEDILLDFVADLCQTAKSYAVQSAPHVITASTKASVDPATLESGTDLSGSTTAIASATIGSSNSRKTARDASKGRIGGAGIGTGGNGVATSTVEKSSGDRLPYHHRRVRVDDFKLALRNDAKKLGRVEELMALQKEIADARKLFDERDS